MEDNVIGNSIKSFRLQNKMSQHALGQKIGVTHASISYWESGVNIPNVKDCWKMADVFNITIDELIGKN